MQRRAGPKSCPPCQEPTRSVAWLPLVVLDDGLLEEAPRPADVGVGELELTALELVEGVLDAPPNLAGHRERRLGPLEDLERFQRLARFLHPLFPLILGAEGRVQGG